MDRFFDAVENGDSKLVAKLLETDPSLANATDTRMSLGVDDGAKPGIKEEAQPSPELRHREKPSTASALQIAVENRQTEVAGILIAAGANVNPDKAVTPLRLAVDRSKGPVSIELVELLIKSGANAREPGGNTALHKAIGGLDRPSPTPKEVIELLLRAGADLTARDRLGVCPLGELMELRKCSDRVAVLRMLLQKGDAGAEHPKFGPLICLAAEKDEPEVLCTLIEAGADVNVSNKWGTPLHYAAHYGFHENVALLLAAGADPCAVDSEGRTPIECVAPQLLEVLSILEKHVEGSTK